MRVPWFAPGGGLAPGPAHAGPGYPVFQALEHTP